MVHDAEVADSHYEKLLRSQLQCRDDKRELQTKLQETQAELERAFSKKKHHQVIKMQEAHQKKTQKMQKEIDDLSQKMEKHPDELTAALTEVDNWKKEIHAGTQATTPTVHTCCLI